MNCSLGTKIKTLRKKLKYCQRDLSCEILNRSVLSKIENNKVTPSIFQLQHIAKKLNVSMEYLLSNDDDYYSTNIDNKPYPLNKLKSLYLNKNFIEIISLYEKNFIDTSKDPAGLFYVGYAYGMLEFYKKSAKLLKKYIKLYCTFEVSTQKLYVEDYITSFNLLCKIYFISCNYKQAIKYAKCALTQIKYNKLLYSKIHFITIRNLSSLYCITNNYKTTVALLENFFRNNNCFTYFSILPSIHINLNIAYYNLGNYEKSVEHIKNAIFIFNYINKKDEAKKCYLNYINALRYSSKFKEALNVLNEFKKLYLETVENDIKINFLMQEIILYFNIGNYKLALGLLKKFNLAQLNSYNRNTYYFIKAHILFTNKKFVESYTYFLKCEKYFLSHYYFYDLKRMYSDLYKITNNKEFKVKFNNCNTFITNNKFKKNIFID